VNNPRTSRSTRLQFAIGLALLLGGNAFAALCAVSAKWWFGYSSDTWLADISGGTLYTRRTEPGARARGWYGGENLNHATDHHWIWTWWTLGKKDLPRERLNTVSIWPLAPALVLAGGVFVHRARRTTSRAVRNQCLKCGYSRTGLAAGIPCPECGEAPDSQ
jgi:hypothetical protein